MPFQKFSPDSHDISSLPATETFSLVGNTYPEILPGRIPDRPIVAVVLKIEEDLRFTGLTDDGNFMRFQPKSPLTDHDNFRGTSGGPIMDSHGQVVSLVCWGETQAEVLSRRTSNGEIADLNDTNGYIYGINLVKFKVAIDVVAGLIPGV